MSQPPLQDVPNHERKVPFAIRINILLAGYVNQVTWVMVGFLSIGFWVFTANTDITGLLLFGDDVSHSEGVITAKTSADLHAGGASAPGAPLIYKFEYTYIDDAGKSHEGLSYGMDRVLNRDYDPPIVGHLGIGNSVRVAYVREKPQISRIVGMRRKPFFLMGFVMLVCFVPAVIYLSFRLVKGFQSTRLLEKGRIVDAKLTDTRSTGKMIKNELVLDYEFAYAACDGKELKIGVRTHVSLILEGTDGTQVAFDARHPRRAVILSALPSQPQVRPDGSVHADPVKSPLKLLLIPCLVVAGNAAAVCWYL